MSRCPDCGMKECCGALYAPLVTELLEALEAVEWVRYTNPDWGEQCFCAECRADKKHGHSDGCTIAATIAAAKGAA